MPVRLPEAAASAYHYPLLIKHLLRTALLTAPEQLIVYGSHHRYTYAAFGARVGRLAAGLAGLGVQPGATVAVLDWDSHRYLECYFAVPMMGAVLQTVNVRMSPKDASYVLQDANAEVVLVAREFLPLLCEIRAALTRVRSFVLLEEPRHGASPRGRPDWICAEYERMLGEVVEEHPFSDFDENAIATAFHTSGTTGAPKGVCFTHRQLVLHTLAALGALASPAHGQCLRRGDVYMPITPMFHVHCWGLPYVATLLGLKQVYPGRYVPSELLALRAREGVTFSHCVPTMLRMLLDAASSGGGSLRGWKMVLGGAALAPSLASEALRAGMDVFAGYGMSETGPILTLSRLDEDSGEMTPQAELEQRCGAGLPIPLVDLKVVDPTSRDRTHNLPGAGEVVVRAPWTTLCYMGRPEASEELWREGYLHTNDVGAIGARGDLRITDRLKDLIKTGGEWVSSLRLEEIIASHPGVLEVAVIAVPDARWGERPHAWVVPRPTQGVVLRPQDILKHVAQHVQRGAIPRYAIPDQVVIVERLEKTTVGKIDKRALRKRCCMSARDASKDG